MPQATSNGPVNPPKAQLEDSSAVEELYSTDTRWSDTANPPEPISGNPLQLEPRHIKALRSLANGRGVKEAAHAAGVSRATVYRWLTEHPAVRAAYETWKAAACFSTHNRVLAMQDLAVEVLEEQLAEKRDARLAARILEKTGALCPPAPGPTRPDRAAVQIAAELREQDVRIVRRDEETRHDARYANVDRRFPDPPPQGGKQ